MRQQNDLFHGHQFDGHAGFVGENIEASAPDATLAQGGDQRVLVDDAAARDVDDHARWSQRVENARVAADLAARAQVGRTVNFAQERLYDGEYVCVMRAGHALAQEPLTLERYCEARHLLVSYSGQAYGFIDEALNALGRSRRVVFTVNQFFTAAHVAAHSDLLSVLPRHFLPLTGIAKQLAARPIPLNLPTIHVDALWHQRNDGRPEHRWLRQTVLGAARQLFGDLG